jgi:hypothetical protein
MSGNQVIAMKTAILLIALSAGALNALAQGGSSSVSAVGFSSVSAVGFTSVSAVTSHAANNGGFSQPPITVTAREAKVNATIAVGTTSAGSITMAGGTVADTTPPASPDDASFPGYPPQDTNAAPANPESSSDIIVVTNSNGSVTDLYPYMNADGDITNANGTVTYDRSKPNWWVK